MSDGYRQSENYARFLAGRVKRVRVQAMEEVDGIRRGRDLSAAKWTFYLRVYTAPKTAAQTFIVAAAMTKVVGTSAAGDTGIAEYDVLIPVSALGTQIMEVVVADTTVNDATTPSGKKEYEIDFPWEIEVYQAAGPT